MAEGYLDSRFTIPPEQREAQATNTVVEGTPPATETQPPVEQPPAETKQTDTGAVAGKVEAPPDKFIEDLNKRFGTQFKADTEVKDIFGLPQKIAGY